jgi:hypothetical protein
MSIFLRPARELAHFEEPNLATVAAFSVREFPIQKQLMSEKGYCYCLNISKKNCSESAARADEI